ncbi:MAG: phosphoadenylyl-sulfate reductase [Deltaproteobacteria bacterium]|nr:MAG: phosphoadenylyl-sulfate reductase [Deltaproteobacteria bacterium]
MNPAETVAATPHFPSDADPREIFRAGRAAAGGPVTLACSFSIDDVVLIDLLKAHHDELTVFAIDTGRLNEETYEVAETVAQRYGLAIQWYFPERAAVEQLERDKGLFSFRESVDNRKECCFIRKVEPLRRALSGFSGWVTGLRRAQSITREELAPIEIDAVNGGLIKINPLLHWSDGQVMNYAIKHRVPVNRLHRAGYPSIGCAPCTRAVQPGEHPRAGRWWWEDPEHKECGLHKR